MLGLGEIEDPHLARAVLQARRALITLEGRCSESRFRHIADWAARTYGVQQSSVVELSQSYWQPVRRHPLTPDGRVIGNLPEPAPRETSRWRIIEDEAQLHLRVTSGTSEAARWLFIGLSFVFMGIIGWATSWHWLTRYVAPIAGLLLSFWSGESFVRRKDAYIIVVRDGILRVTRKDRLLVEQAMSAVQFIDAIPSTEDGEVDLVLARSAEGEDQEKIASGLDPASAFTVAALVEQAASNQPTP